MLNRCFVTCSSSRFLFSKRSDFLLCSMATTRKPNQTAMDDVVKGKFVRKESVFCNWIKKDGSTGFTHEADRYHSYLSLACPCVHRALITRAMIGLQHVLPVSIVHHDMKDGWRFITTDEKDVPSFCEPKPLYRFKSIHELYFKADSEYDGCYIMPVLCDMKLVTIVNNKMSEIIVMFNEEFDDFAKHPDIDLYPMETRK